MYSYFPMGDVGHFGFWWALFSCIFLIVALGLIQFFDLNAPFWPTPLLIVVSTIFMVVVHNNSYKKPLPVNTPVAAIFIGFMAESAEVKSGRSRRTEHYLYARFKTPDGEVAIVVDDGTPIPEHVTLYKN